MEQLVASIQVGKATVCPWSEVRRYMLDLLCGWLGLLFGLSVWAGLLAVFHCQMGPFAGLCNHLWFGEVSEFLPGRVVTPVELHIWATLQGRPCNSSWLMEIQVMLPSLMVPLARLHINMCYRQYFIVGWELRLCSVIRQNWSLFPKISRTIVLASQSIGLLAVICYWALFLARLSDWEGPQAVSWSWAELDTAIQLIKVIVQVAPQTILCDWVGSWVGSSHGSGCGLGCGAGQGSRLSSVAQQYYRLFSVAAWVP